MAGAPSGDPEHRRPLDATEGSAGAALRALVVDDEAPALEELSWLLRQDDRIAEVLTASAAPTPCASLEEGPVDVVFSDIYMPGSTASTSPASRSSCDRPQIVFVTAYDAARRRRLRAATPPTTS